MGPRNDLKLTMVSHACVKIEGNFGALLCDPWILNEPVYNFTTWKYPLSVMPTDDILHNVTHVYISHSHEDHFHVPSLDLLPRDVTLVLPEYSWHPGLRAQTIERTMRRMGFHDIHKIMPWGDYALDEETTLTIIPAAESKPRDWENSGLVIDHPNVRILNVNDCPSDKALYKKLSERFERFDVALLQYAGVSMYPGRFRMTEAELREAVKNKQASFVEQERAVTLLNIDKIVPFAGDFCWLDAEMFHCNWACRATPLLFKDWHSKFYKDTNQEVVIMYPSDTWSKNSGLEKNHSGIDWDDYLSDLKDVQSRFMEKVDAINNWFAESPVEDLEKRTGEFLHRMMLHVCREYINFSATISFVIERDSAPLEFSIWASPEEGFCATVGKSNNADHVCYLSEAQWASVLAGKIMFNTLHWTSEIDQQEPYNPDVGRFWWWLEYYGDLNNKGAQILLDQQQFAEAPIPDDPQRGVFGPYI